MVNVNVKLVGVAPTVARVIRAQALTVEQMVSVIQVHVNVTTDIMVHNVNSLLDALVPYIIIMRL